MMEHEFEKARCDIEHFIFIKAREIKKALNLPYTFEDELLDEIDYGYKTNCQWLVDLNYKHLREWRIFKRESDRKLEEFYENMSSLKARCTRKAHFETEQLERFGKIICEYKL